MRTVVARMTGNVFLGAPTCRDPRWLKISIDFSIDLFMTAFTIKMFPPWMYWLVTWLIPSRHRVYRQVKTARGIVGNLIRQHAAANEKRARGIQVEEQDTILNWMLDHGTPSECAIPEMAARQCVLTLASIHTTATNISNILYDLCAYPEWFPVLRQEIDDIAKELGTPGGDPNVTAREWCTRLDKLDSFFVESQRHSPVILRESSCPLLPTDLLLAHGTLTAVSPALRKQASATNTGKSYSESSETRRRADHAERRDPDPRGNEDRVCQPRIPDGSG